MALAFDQTRMASSLPWLEGCNITLVQSAYWHILGVSSYYLAAVPAETPTYKIIVHLNIFFFLKAIGTINIGNIQLPLHSRAIFPQMT